MNCIMTRGLYLRADGRLPCYCSAGETVTLGRLDHGNLPGDIAADVFESSSFTRIRAAMAQGKAPFPGVHLPRRGRGRPGLVGRRASA